MSTSGRLTPLWAAIATFAVVAGLVAGVLQLRDDDGGQPSATARPLLEVQIVQTRPDAVNHRLELAVTNLGTGTLNVDRIRLTADGLTGAGWVPKDSPVPEGQRVNLPTFYGKPRCPADGEPVLGAVRVDLRVHVDDGQQQSVRVTPRESRGLLNRLIRSYCQQVRLSREVALSFGPRWRTEGRGDATRLHTTLEARLAPGAAPREVTQLAGTVLYQLKVDGAGASPYASLDAAHPSAAVPVVLFQGRCTGHAKGEVKQPYAFLVWVGDPGTEGQAVEVPVRPTERTRLRAICAF
jgi:hypothetical protein